MENLRNSTLQRLLILVFLCTSLLSQTQMLYACEMMDGKPKPVCCCGERLSDVCPMADACGLFENAEATRCCEISHDALTDEAVMHGASTADLLTQLLDGPQPPPVIDLRPLSPAALSTFSLPVPLPDAPPVSRAGAQTYLHTLRLRL